MLHPPGAPAADKYRFVVPVTENLVHGVTAAPTFVRGPPAGRRGRGGGSGGHPPRMVASSHPGLAPDTMVEELINMS